MNRKILLVEPNYKNKYPPIGLMKLATYYRMCGDDVRFFKGNIRTLPLILVCEDLVNHLEILFPQTFWKQYIPSFTEYIKLGRMSSLEHIPEIDNDDVLDAIKEYRKKYISKDYFKNPRFDRVGVTTLFTFYWKITIDTINFVKQLCKSPKDVMVGGIMASLVPADIEKETGIAPTVGLLSKPGVLDKDNTLIIDELPLDYSILDEIDYEYPTKDAYFAYMTRGCVNKCKFCAVPTLEPKYKDYISLKKQIEIANERFGARKNLMLLDNNVLASKKYTKIVNEIIKCGFEKNAMYYAPNEYDIAIRNLKDSYNDRAYIRKIVKIYREIALKLHESDNKALLYKAVEAAHCLYDYTATKEAILSIDHIIKPLYEKTHSSHIGRKRIIDFNQGIDSRLITAENMQILAKTNIEPLRIAFDHWSLRATYINSVKTAVHAGICRLSNYLLYNFEDKPEDLYNRLRTNVDLCEELDVTIYSFPMKYHPIQDPKYFKNRDYLGAYWNRKFVRAVQAVLNSTKGKIGRGIAFFEEAFGRDVNEFMKILWMPETFIIYRRKYDACLRERLADKYNINIPGANDLANEWWNKFSALTPKRQEKLKLIVEQNKFDKRDYNCNDKAVLEVLKYYQIYTRGS